MWFPISGVNADGSVVMGPASPLSRNEDGPDTYITNVPPITTVAGLDAETGGNLLDTTNVNVVIGYTGPLAGPTIDITTTMLCHYMIVKGPKLRVGRKVMPAPSVSHVDYTVTIPNAIGYPEHKRCLISVQECWLNGTDLLNSWSSHLPPMVGIELIGLGGHNVYSTSNGNWSEPSGVMNKGTLVGFGMLTPIGSGDHVHRASTWFVGDHHSSNYATTTTVGFRNERDITQDGVLVGSPFGRSVRVRIINMATGQPIQSMGSVLGGWPTGQANNSVSGGGLIETSATDTIPNYGVPFHEDYGAIASSSIYHTTPTAQNGIHHTSAIDNNPTQIVLRVLFLDDDEIPDR